MFPMKSSVTPLHSLGQDDQNKVQHNFWSCDTTATSIGITLCKMVLSMASLYFLGEDNWIEMQHDFSGMWCHWNWHHMMPMALSVAHSTDVSNGTSTSTKCHIIPLNNHLNITNTMVQLTAPSTPCYCHVHDQNEYALHIPKISHTYQLVPVHRWHLYLSINASYKPTAINNMNRTSEIHLFYIIVVCPWTIMLTHAVHLYHCVTTVVSYRAHITAIWVKQNNNLQLLLPCYCHICAKKNMPLKCHM